ncbi:MAG: hypothetical protein LJE75_10625 [Gammaproteobacteria bacterium]|nr:hypothetical protein [Gammaproteobacteria bacterium]
MDRDQGNPNPNGNGHRIFVKLWGNPRIMLTEGDFGVIDYNGLDGEATFSLPAADADCDGSSDYSAYVRGVGMKGSSTIETCFVDKATGDLLCSGEEITVIEGGKKPKFTNVSKSLLTVVFDADDDGDRHSIILQSGDVGPVGRAGCYFRQPDQQKTHSREYPFHAAFGCEQYHPGD